MFDRSSRLLVLPVLAAVTVALAACTPSGPTRSPAPAAHAAVERSTGSRTSADGVLVSTSVGNSTFRLQRRHGDVRFTASLDGGVPVTNDADHNWDLIADPAAVAADAAVRLDGGSFPTQRIGTVAGRAGQDVREIDVVPQRGQRIRAALTDGWWIAAWRGGDLGQDAGAEVVLHRTDGSTVRLPAAQLSR